jgi:hypothetical protein
VDRGRARGGHRRLTSRDPGRSSSQDKNATTRAGCRHEISNRWHVVGNDDRGTGPQRLGDVLHPTPDLVGSAGCRRGFEPRTRRRCRFVTVVGAGCCCDRYARRRTGRYRTGREASDRDDRRGRGQRRPAGAGGLGRNRARNSVPRLPRIRPPCRCASWAESLRRAPESWPTARRRPPAARPPPQSGPGRRPAARAGRHSSGPRRAQPCPRCPYGQRGHSPAAPQGGAR